MDDCFWQFLLNLPVLQLGENLDSLSLSDWKAKVIPSCYILICIIIYRLLLKVLTFLFLFFLKLEVMWVQYLVYFYFSVLEENTQIIHLPDRILRIEEKL